MDFDHFDPPASAGSPHYPHASFRHPVPIDPSLAHSRRALPPEFYGNPRSSVAPSTPLNTTPPSNLASYIPNDRTLPPHANVSDDTIDDAYAAFILYCNPTFPISTDTTELKKAFRAPPKSDGKSFSVWDLFELVRKFEQKEIKTWTQLALDLGVEPPSTEKGQSTQKVQQYSVRLKRWMRALHIDAFFEYLLGKHHTYYKDIPSIHDPFPESGRDGVPLEEDLSIRALDPKFRPKRGRRRAEDDEADIGTPHPKRPQLDTSMPFAVTTDGFADPQSAYPSSAIPMSAHPDDMDRFNPHDSWPPISAITPSTAGHNIGRSLTPYSAMAAPSVSHLRWRVNETPTTPHPLSAMTPASAHPDSGFDEAESAMTPSSSRIRSRRRHGPAVSSAWPSNSTAGGKLRGRPPSNRSVRDGPFVTFPANPDTKEGPTIDLGRNSHSTTAPAERTEPDSAVPREAQHFRFPPTTNPVSAPSPTPPTSATQGRRERLSLQVPQHVGGPVQLITPTLLVNGEVNPSPPFGVTPSSVRSTPRPLEDSASAENNFASSASRGQGQSEHAASVSFSAEDLKRALAADLLRADIKGRRRLRGNEAKLLAGAILRASRKSSNQLAGVDDEVLRMQTHLLGLSVQMGLSVGPSLSHTRTIVAQRFRVSQDGYDSPIDEEEEVDEGMNVKETFDVSWNLTIGDLSGGFQLKGLTLKDGDANDDEKRIDPAAELRMDDSAAQKTVAELKERVLALKKQLAGKDEEVQKLKDKVLDAVL